jgi:ketosteroid isomerase-like protein
LAFTLGACGAPPKECPPEKECPAAPAAAAMTGDWDPAAATAQKETVDRMFKALDNGNAEYFEKTMDEDMVIFDVDADGKPIARRGKRAVEYINKMTKDMKDAGVTVQTTVGRTDCHGTATVGFCAIEFKQVVTKAGKAGEPMDMFGTTVMHKVGDDWKFAHWHGGLGVETKEREGDGPGGKAPGDGDGDKAKGGKQGKKAP